MKPSKAFLFFWKSNFMYIGKGITTKIHDHHAIQLIIDLNGEFELYSDSKGHEKFKAVLISSDFPHECITGDDTMLILNISPESRVGINLKTGYLAGNGYKAIENEFTPGFVKELMSLINAEINEKSIVAATERFLNKLSGTESPTPIDGRIKLALTLLKKNEWDVITVKDIANSVFISESRLIHLFKQQVGLPIRKYILWLRLVKAIQYSLQNNNITKAAIAAGFSDAPHFNKTLKRMFGLNLTNLKYSQFIQAYWV